MRPKCTQWVTHIAHLPDFQSDTCSITIDEHSLCDTGSAVPKHQEWEAELAKELAMQRSQHRHMSVKS